MQSLNGRVALITGAASGLGAALARACAAQGMRVVASDLQASELDGVVAGIVEAGGSAVAEAADVLEPSAAPALVNAACEHFGALDLLVNNAGVMPVVPLVETAEEDWSWVLGVNLLAAARLVAAAVPRMRAKRGPWILNVASMSGFAPALEVPIGGYATSKSALITYSEVLARELEADGIGVSVVCPGGMATGIFQAERHRPAQQRPAGLESRPSRAAVVPDGLMSPDEAAQRILEGMRHERFYIFTHPDQWARLEQRFARIRADFDAARDAAR